MRAKSGEKGGEWLRRKSRNDKWNAKTKRIDSEQTDTLEHCRLRRRQSENRGQDRPNAGCPAESEGKPHKIGAPQADRLRNRKPLLPLEPGNRRNAEKMQTHRHDSEAG